MIIDERMAVFIDSLDKGNSSLLNTIEKEALEAGMNVHLAKPIDVELLKKVIKQYIQKK